MNSVEGLSKGNYSGNVCCVPGCRSKFVHDRKISFSKFPSDQKRRDLWIQRINRKGVDGTWTPKKHNKVCGLHFNPLGKRGYLDKDPYIFPFKTFERIAKPEDCTIKKIYILKTKQKDIESSKPASSIEEYGSANDTSVSEYEKLRSEKVISTSVNEQSSPLVVRVPGIECGRVVTEPIATKNIQAHGHDYNLPATINQLKKLLEEREKKLEQQNVLNENLSREITALKTELNTKKGDFFHEIVGIENELKTTKSKLQFAINQRIIVESKLDDLQTEMKSQRFRIENVSQDKEALKFYTGFSKKQEFHVLFKYLEPDLNLLNLRNSGNAFIRKTERCESSKTGRPMSLNFENQLFLILCRLRLGLLEEDLSFRFRISTATVCNYCNTWIHFLRSRLKQIPEGSSNDILEKYLPVLPFREKYFNTTVITDRTESCFETT